ncbi:probable caffeoyl-CoA O-methyltransferase At4g26220 [Coffea eugenioides]|uniref:probable caffeoyl-CoA O-methyltransferase At4g26220 n=1 Tax=Coffea eugenioides TaxID=49369 RepID=UPI000F615DDD|nr:probable caffeoyl-CoA O-methyltransferase At4g26220 [Coffea eugenioides]
MGSEGLLRSPELRQYLVETSLYPREPQVLKDLRAVTATHPMGIMGTDADAGQMLSLLLEIINAKKTIEIGVFTLHCLLLNALTIPQDGKIMAIDPDQEAHDIGLPFIKKAGVEHKINFINSVAHPVLDNLLEDSNEHDSFDFAYVDADKANYAKYHEKLLKLVKVGGIIVYDNTLWMGTVAEAEDSVPETLRESRLYIKELNKSLAADPRVQICHLPSRFKSGLE